MLDIIINNNLTHNYCFANTLPRVLLTVLHYVITDESKVTVLVSKRFK